MNPEEIDPGSIVQATHAVQFKRLAAMIGHLHFGQNSDFDHPGYLTMLRTGISTILLLSNLTIATAEPLFTGPDFSGEYTCKGNDGSEGDYTATVTLTRVKEHSTGRKGAYLFKLEVPGFGSYPGHAASQGRDMAIYFANTDPSTKDYGTGLARFSKTPAGLWTFEKFYFEPEYKGGNHGTETCTQKKVR